AADAARPLDRSERRVVCGRRRLPVHLRVHRRDAALPARSTEALSGRDRDPARDELPLHARGARTGEPDRAGARRRRKGLARLAKLEPTPVVAAAVRGYAQDAGWVERPPDKLGERELVRQADLGRLVKLAAEFDDGVRTTRDLIADLEARFGTTGRERSGVHLLTLHGAKGLEF